MFFNFDLFPKPKKITTKNPKQELFDLPTCDLLITTWKPQDKLSPIPILCPKVIKATKHLMKKQK